MYCSDAAYLRYESRWSGMCCPIVRLRYPFVLYRPTLGQASRCAHRRWRRWQRKAGQVATIELAQEVFVVRVLDGEHACGASGFDVLDAVVDEQHCIRRLADLRDRKAVDSLVRLDDAHAMRKDATLESGDPWEAIGNPGLHGVAHIREDAGGYARALQCNRPVDHRQIGLRPEIEVGLKEFGELIVGRRMAEFSADGAPEADAVQDAEVVVLAVAPVRVAQLGMCGVEDRFHALLRHRIRRAAEDEPIVKENRTDLWHRVRL